MRPNTVRISAVDHAALSRMSTASGKSMAKILSEAVRELRRKRLLMETNEAYARLKADPLAWGEEIAERQIWESTLMDGLE